MGEPVRWDDKFMFEIEIDGITYARAQSISDLNIEGENVQHWEGGRRHPHNSLGRVTYPEITIVRAATDDEDFYNWMKDTYNPESGEGPDTPDQYRTFDVIQLNSRKQPIKRWTVFNAYSRAFSAGNFNATENDKRVESVTIQPDYWKQTPV